jgi:hypothetical protein
MAMSPKDVLSVSCVSDAVFPSLIQNFTQMRCSFKSAISLITENRGSHLTRATINTRWEATQRVMEAKLTRLAHKIAMQLHVVAESCTIYSSRSGRPVRKLLDTIVLRKKLIRRKEILTAEWSVIICAESVQWLGYRLEDRGSIPRRAITSRRSLGPTQSPFRWVKRGTESSFRGVKRLGGEADHSPPSSAEVKEWVEL